MKPLDTLDSLEKFLFLNLPKSLLNLSNEHLERIKAAIEVELRERDINNERN